MFKKIFSGNGEKFSGTYEAEAWLEINGYSVGAMARHEPRGVMKGVGIFIGKWRNLSEEERQALDGRLYVTHDGTARLELNQSPDFSE